MNQEPIPLNGIKDAIEPDVDESEGEKGVEAGFDALPADDKTAKFSLEPGEGSLGLESGRVALDGAPFGFGSRWPDPLGNLGTDSTASDGLTKLVGVVSLVAGQHLDPLRWPARLACFDFDAVEQGHDLGPLRAVGWCGGATQRHAVSSAEGVDEHAFALEANPDALTTALARGKKSHRWLRTPT